VILERRNSVTSYTIGGAGSKSDFSSHSSAKTTATVDRRGQAEQEFGQASLYILCEKNQSKVRPLYREGKAIIWSERFNKNV